MAHPDHEQLVLIALGDLPFDAAFEAHLASCDACAEEYLAMQRVALIGGQTEDLRDLPEPPERVWQRIAAQAFAPQTDAERTGWSGGRADFARSRARPDLAGADGRHAAARPGSDRRGPGPGQPAARPRLPAATATHRHRPGPRRGRPPPGRPDPAPVSSWPGQDCPGCRRRAADRHRRDRRCGGTAGWLRVTIRHGGGGRHLHPQGRRGAGGDRHRHRGADTRRPAATASPSTGCRRRRAFTKLGCTTRPPAR